MRVSAIAPLFGYHQSSPPFDESFDLGQGVSIASIPEWVREQGTLKKLTDRTARRVLSEPQFALILEVDSDTYDTGPWLNRLGTANEALWLAQPSNIGFDAIVYASYTGGVWRESEFVHTRQLVAHRRDFPKKHTVDTLIEAKEIFATLLRLQGGERGPVVVALQTLWLALVEEWYEIRYLLLWIVLESLFGPEDGKRMTYKLSKRIARFLAPSPEDADGLSIRAKQLYGLRSTVVHGMRLNVMSPGEREAFLGGMHESEMFARKSVIRLHKDASLVAALNSANRERYLEDQFPTTPRR